MIKQVSVQHIELPIDINSCLFNKMDIGYADANELGFLSPNLIFSGRNSLIYGYIIPSLVPFDYSGVLALIQKQIKLNELTKAFFLFLHTIRLTTKTSICL